MKQYRVEITETLQKTITVLAENENAAIDEAKDLYGDCEVILDYNDFSDVDFEIVEF